MVMLPDSVAWLPALSVTFTVTANVPALVGVPVSRGAPGAGWDTPGGSFPVTVQVNGPVPPDEKKFCR